MSILLIGCTHADAITKTGAELDEDVVGAAVANVYVLKSLYTW